MTQKKVFIFTLAVMITFAGCASRSYRFSDSPAIQDAGDRQPSPVPEKDGFNSREYMISGGMMEAK